MTSQMESRDIRYSFFIGALVGLLAQPIISNFSAKLAEASGVPILVLRVAVFLLVLVGAPAALFIVSRVVPFLYQFSKFVSVGALNTTIDLGFFNLETLLYGTKPTGVVFATFKGISFIVATTNSFFWNKHWTFGATAKAEAAEILKFYVIAAIGFGINVGIATAVFKAGGTAPSALWTNIISPFAGIFSTFLWNFLGYKYLVFKKT